MRVFYTSLWESDSREMKHFSNDGTESGLIASQGAVLDARKHTER